MMADIGRPPEYFDQELPDSAHLSFVADGLPSAMNLLHGLRLRNGHSATVCYGSRLPPGRVAGVRCGDFPQIVYRGPVYVSSVKDGILTGYYPPEFVVWDVGEMDLGAERGSD